MRTSPSLEEIRQRLRDLIPLLAERYHVESIALFGSYIRGEQRPDSDLDILVTFSQPPGLLQFVELENYLTDVLGVKVDLVMKSGLKPRIGAQILREAIPI